MTESLQPTSASLSAKIIRACPVHPICPLTCPERRIEDLGEVASFSIEQPSAHPSFTDRLKSISRRFV